MRVWLVSVGEPLPIAVNAKPRLMRTGTLARRLVEKGHQVSWWTSTFDHRQKRHVLSSDSVVTWDGGTIRLLKSTGYSRNVSISRLVDHAVVARRFAAEVQRQPMPDIILASFPIIQLAREAVKFAKARNIPVLVDVRDLWPDVLLSVLPGTLQSFGRVMLAPMFGDTAYALRNCTGIIGISEGYLQWGLRYARRSPAMNDAVVPLGYVASSSDKCDLEAAGRRLLAMGVAPEKKLCLYSGSFGRQYDLAPVLRAASLLQQAGRKDVQFVICGGGDFESRWRQLAGGSDNVIFTGWIGADEINWLRVHSTLGLQPYAEGAPQGLANKLFEYLSAGLPVVSSLRGENQRLLDEYECGLTYRAGDAVDCLEKIKALVDDEGLCCAMGQRGKALFLRRFDGEVVFDGLVAHLEAAADRHRDPLSVA